MDRAARDRVGAALGAVSAADEAVVGAAVVDGGGVGAAAGACDRRLRGGFAGAVGAAGWPARADAGAGVLVAAAARRDVARRARRGLAGAGGAAADLDCVRPPGRDRWIEVSARRADSKEAISARTSASRTSIAAVISCIFGMPGS